MLMLGVPQKDLTQARAWSDEIALFVGHAVETDDKYQRAQDATRAMAAYFSDLVQARRRAPRDDLISALIDVFAETWQTRVIIFTMLMGSLLILMQRSGGIQAFVTWVGRKPALMRKPAAVAFVEAIELSARCKDTS